MTMWGIVATTALILCGLCLASLGAVPREEGEQ